VTRMARRPCRSFISPGELVLGPRPLLFVAEHELKECAVDKGVLLQPVWGTVFVHGRFLLLCHGVGAIELPRSWSMNVKASWFCTSL